MQNEAGPTREQLLIFAEELAKMRDQCVAMSLLLKDHLAGLNTTNAKLAQDQARLCLEKISALMHGSPHLERRLQDE
jgi:hypothetical protein